MSSSVIWLHELVKLGSTVPVGKVTLITELFPLALPASSTREFCVVKPAV